MHAERVSNANLKYSDTLKKGKNKPTFTTKKYLGEYLHDGFGLIAVSQQGSQLMVKIGNIKEEMEHWKNDSFRIILKDFNEDYIFTFVYNDENKIVSLKTDLFESNTGLTEFKKRL